VTFAYAKRSPQRTPDSVTRHQRLTRAIPAALAAVGLAVPMVGSGFIGWPVVLVWLVVLLFIRWVEPLGAAPRETRIGGGIAAIFALALLGTVGGFYLVPSVVSWLILVLTKPARDGVLAD
jgi:hypothetical protein